MHSSYKYIVVGWCGCCIHCCLSGNTVTWYLYVALRENVWCCMKRNQKLSNNSHIQHVVAAGMCAILLGGGVAVPEALVLPTRAYAASHTEPSNTPQVLQFKDPHLKTALLLSMKSQKLLSEQATDITVADAQKVTDLGDIVSTTGLDGMEISDISGLEYFTNVTKLNLSYNQISNLSPLKSLTKLEELYLEQNDISDISVVKDLSNLKKLDVSNMKITDWAPYVVPNIEVANTNQLTSDEIQSLLREFDEANKDISPYINAKRANNGNYPMRVSSKGDVTFIWEDGSTSEIGAWQMVKQKPGTTAPQTTPGAPAEYTGPQHTHIAKENHIHDFSPILEHATLRQSSALAASGLTIDISTDKNEVHVADYLKPLTSFVVKNAAQADCLDENGVYHASPNETNSQLSFAYKKAAGDEADKTQITGTINIHFTGQQANPHTDPHTTPHTNPHSESEPSTTNSWGYPISEISDSSDRTDKVLGLYRLYNPWTGEHLFTTSTKERDDLVSGGWRFENTAIRVHTQLGDPVYRLLNPWTGEHHYTTDAKEVGQDVQAGWKNEGITFRSSGSKGMVSMYNPHVKSFYHHYTSDPAEIARMERDGWIRENIKWYCD